MAGGVCATIAYLIGSHPLNDSAHSRANAALGSRGRPSRPRRQAGGLLPRDADQAAGEAAKPRQRAKRKTAAGVAAMGGATDRPPGAGQAVCVRSFAGAHRRGLRGADRRDPAPDDPHGAAQIRLPSLRGRSALPSRERLDGYYIGIEHTLRAASATNATSSINHAATMRNPLHPDDRA